MTERTETNSKAIHFLRRYKWLLIPLLLLCIAVIMIAALSARSLGRLDDRIQQVFDGPKWSIPARVYARPLELYVGLEIDQRNVEQELTRLGYQPTDTTVKKPGLFNKGAPDTKSALTLYTRGFRFADGFEPAKLLKIPTHTEDRLLVNLEQLPKGLVDALLAVEDPKFYQHNGISIKGILRAIWVNVKERRYAQGGSTITQQLVKNLFLTRERSLRRKLTEWPMAITLERRYSKDEILQAFTNEVFFAQDSSRAIHGFGLASLYLFSKPIQELDTHEYALLVAMLKGPSYYDPIRHPERARTRRNLVLKIMHRDGLLTADALAHSLKQPLSIAKSKDRQQPAYLDLVKNQLTRDYSTEDLHKNGLNRITSSVRDQSGWQRRSTRHARRTRSALCRL